MVFRAALIRAQFLRVIARSHFLDGRMELKPRDLLLVLLVFGVLLAGIFRFGAAERAQQGPSLLRLDQQGDLYVVFNEKLFRLSPDGTHAKTYDLPDLGVAELIGGFAFFSDGDVLLRTGDSSPNWYEQILIQLRMRQPTHQTGTPGDRLARCNLETLACLPLEGFEQTFKRTFRIDIDANDNIFIADTGREALYWLDANGYRLSQVGSGFRLPNQLVRDGETVVVTNTNRQELTFVSIKGEQFLPAQDWYHLKVDVPEAKQTGEVWPMDLIRVGNEWWVLSQQHNMMYGDVFRFSEDGGYLGQLNLPDEVDPLGLARLGEDIIVADYAGLKLLRFDVRGEPRGELSVPELVIYANEVSAARERYAGYQTMLWALFSIALVAGFAIAIFSHLRGAPEHGISGSVVAAPSTAQTLSQSDQPTADDADIHWLSPGNSFQRQIKLMVGLTIAFVLAGVLVVLSHFGEIAERLEDDKALIAFCLGLVSLLLAPIGLVIVLRKLPANWRIGVVREWIVLRAPLEKVAIGRGQSVGIAPNAIVIDDVAIPTGGRKAPMFDADEWVKWVEPRLTEARKLNALDMVAWSWKYQRKLNLLMLSAFVLLLAIWLLVR